MVEPIESYSFYDFLSNHAKLTTLYTEPLEKILAIKLRSSAVLGYVYITITTTKLLKNYY